MIALRIIAFAVGAFLVVRAVASAVRVFVLPRASNEPIARFVFINVRRLFDAFTPPSKPYASATASSPTSRRSRCCSSRSSG